MDVDVDGWDLYSLLESELLFSLRFHPWSLASIP